MAKGEKKAKQLQRRRLRAGRLLARGVAQAEVARRVRVSRATVCEWNARLEQGGLDALKRRPRGSRESAESRRMNARSSTRKKSGRPRMMLRLKGFPLSSE